MDVDAVTRIYLLSSLLDHFLATGSKWDCLYHTTSYLHEQNVSRSTFVYNGRTTTAVVCKRVSCKEGYRRDNNQARGTVHTMFWLLPNLPDDSPVFRSFEIPAVVDSAHISDILADNQRIESLDEYAYQGLSVLRWAAQQSGQRTGKAIIFFIRNCMPAIEGWYSEICRLYFHQHWEWKPTEYDVADYDISVKGGGELDKLLDRAGLVKGTSGSYVFNSNNAPAWARALWLAMKTLGKALGKEDELAEIPQQDDVPKEDGQPEVEGELELEEELEDKQEQREDTKGDGLQKQEDSDDREQPTQQTQQVEEHSKERKGTDEQGEDEDTDDETPSEEQQKVLSTFVALFRLRLLVKKIPKVMWQSRSFGSILGRSKFESGSEPQMVKPAEMVDRFVEESLGLSKSRLALPEETTALVRSLDAIVACTTSVQYLCFQKIFRGSVTLRYSLIDVPENQPINLPSHDEMDELVRKWFPSLDEEAITRFQDVLKNIQVADASQSMCCEGAIMAAIGLQEGEQSLQEIPLEIRQAFEHILKDHESIKDGHETKTISIATSKPSCALCWELTTLSKGVTFRLPGISGSRHPFRPQVPPKWLSKGLLETLEGSLAGKLNQMLDEEKWEESANIDFDFLYE